VGENEAQLLRQFTTKQLDTSVRMNRFLSKAGSWLTGAYHEAERRLRKPDTDSAADGRGELVQPGRALFLSERRHIRHMMKINHGVDWTGNPPVLYEEHCEPRRPVRWRAFNSDYLLCFTPNGDLPADFRSCCARVLPRTMGAEVFLMIDTATKEPIRVELLSGEAFQLKDFRPHADRLEAALVEVGVPLQLKRCKHCRMFVIEDEICFLVYPHGRTEGVGSPTVLRRDNDAEIRSYSTAGQLQCVDGWLRTEVEPNEDDWILESYLDDDAVEDDTVE
jgi:hypothetical protein